MSLDVFTFGEAMIRLSTRVGQSLETAPQFDVHVAGTELNVATSLAGLDRRVAWGSRLPDNPFGRRVLGHLRAVGLDDSGVEIVSNQRLGIYFVEMREPPFPARVVYDRKDSGASHMTPDDIPWNLVESATLVHLTGITPALSESCLRTVGQVMKRARAANCMVSFDVNYRATLWTPREAAAVLGELLGEIDVLVSSLEDAVALFGTTDSPPMAVDELARRFGVDRVVVTSGASGSFWLDRGRKGHRAAIPVNIVDRLGAGDAFMAGVIDGVLSQDLAAGVEIGTALAAKALATRGDQPIVDRRELDVLLEGSGRSVDR